MSSHDDEILKINEINEVNGGAYLGGVGLRVHRHLVNLKERRKRSKGTYLGSM
jgi:hypothetical protein